MATDLTCTICKRSCRGQEELDRHGRSAGHHLHLQLFPSGESPSSLPLHLDSLFIQYFRWNERRISMLDDLRKMISDGLFELGRARYQHGTKSISTLSFDMTMRALTIVERQSDGSLSLASSPAEASDDSDGEDGDSKATETQDGLRNRTESVKDGRPATKVAKTTRDPLKWFGVLAPQSLRTSQAHFKKALHTSTAIASVVSQLQVLQKEYLRLLHAKLRGAEGK